MTRAKDLQRAICLSDDIVRYSKLRGQIDETTRFKLMALSFPHGEQSVGSPEGVFCRYDAPLGTLAEALKDVTLRYYDGLIDEGSKELDDLGVTDYQP